MNRENTAYEAAVMYFVQDEKMEMIARKLNVSRSTVSRLIQHARDTGMVQISLNPPGGIADTLAGKYRDRFGVRLHLVPISPNADSGRRMNAIANLCASVVSDLVRQNSIIGVAWGNTVSAVAAQLPTKAVPGSVVVQLNGAANATTTGVPYVGSIMEAFGAAFGAHVQHFSVPAFFDYAQTRDMLWKERSIAAVRSLQERADIAVFGVGSHQGASASHVYTGGYLSPQDMVKLNDDGVVGDVCTVMMRADGSSEDLEINHRASGPPFEVLKRIKHRVCVVSGPEKLAATLAALRAGVVTDLVIDEHTAVSLDEAA